MYMTTFTTLKRLNRASPTLEPSPVLHFAVTYTQMSVLLYVLMEGVQRDANPYGLSISQGNRNSKPWDRDPTNMQDTLM